MEIEYRISANSNDILSRYFSICGKDRATRRWSTVLLLKYAGDQKLEFGSFAQKLTLLYYNSVYSVLPEQGRLPVEEFFSTQQRAAPFRRARTIVVIRQGSEGLLRNPTLSVRQSVLPSLVRRSFGFVYGRRLGGERANIN